MYILIHMFFRQSDKCGLWEGQPCTNFKRHVTNEETAFEFETCNCIILYYIILYYIILYYIILYSRGG